ncbi:hypothetical protein [Paracraurococcus lichenis]|uniref:VWA domain-containing protein n=1 Tax=Paracraurococcus lichenis TaxID=3064888 RepID=A0ABT9E8G8_9PROT|nr:hypothetical protein [Paracraurococcus sp. LOR1-02]MDO9712480.1 hypothetical protein [Paracraurococcus sp. LOR1-02]
MIELFELLDLTNRRLGVITFDRGSYHWTRIDGYENGPFETSEAALADLSTDLRRQVLTRPIGTMDGEPDLSGP